MRPIIVDLGEFYGAPLRTGIQRTVCELLAHWPQDVPARFARYDPHVDGLISISSRAIAFLVKMFGKNTLSPAEISAEARMIDAGIHSGKIDLHPEDKVLLPELFYRFDRVAFYQRAIEQELFQPYMLIYDFVPWLKPDLYGIGGNMYLFMPYLRLVMAATKRSYISATVRDDLAKQILRGTGDVQGPAITLGADGIDLEPQEYTADRRNIVCLGTLEAKKFQDVAFEAFRSLPPDPSGGKLQFLGKIPSFLQPQLAQIVEYVGADVEVIDNPSDDEIRGHLRQARASLFVSPNEGFGLPALETLFCGIPTVVSANLPSVSGLSDEGQIRLETVDVSSVAAALMRLRDEKEIQVLWSAAAKLTLPRWKDFAISLATWVAKN
jgi:glycosyltransferase involved in cell wall biosynthesis